MAAKYFDKRSRRRLSAGRSFAASLLLFSSVCQGSCRQTSLRWHLSLQTVNVYGTALPSFFIWFPFWLNSWWLFHLFADCLTYIIRLSYLYYNYSIIIIYIIIWLLHFLFRQVAVRACLSVPCSSKQTNIETIKYKVRSQSQIKRFPAVGRRQIKSIAS